MKVVLIYNTTSGGEYGLRHLKTLLKQYDVSVEYSFTVKELNSRKLAQLIAKGITVAAVGGDGTLNAVARLLVGTKSILLPLPGGTFNHFIRDLGMSAQIEENLAALSTANVEKIDVGYVNDELFLNNSNLGLYPFSLIERKQTKKVLGKYAAAVLSAFDQLSVFRRHKLIIDGQKIRSPFIFVGNNIYDIKQSLIPQRTQLNQGVLTVMIATSGSRLALIRDIFAVVRGDVSRNDDFTVDQRKSLTIHSHRKSLPVSFDGEVKNIELPLKYRTAPKQLKVLVVKPL